MPTPTSPQSALLDLVTSFVQDPGQEAGRLVALPGVPALSLRSKANRLGVFTIRSVQMI
jgi:hypothetical protein